MNKIYKILLILIFLTSCSLHQNSKFWKTEKIKKETDYNIEKIFVKEKTLNLDFNPGLKISLYSKPIKKSFFNNYDNNNGRINYDGRLENISKFKFSKIINFYQYDPKIAFDKNNIIFLITRGLY